MQVSAASQQLLADLLRLHTGQHLPPARGWRIGTALSGLLREHDIADLDQLNARLLSRQSSLARKVVEALLNNETYFFRDRAVFDTLDQHVLPALAQARGAGRQLSIWSAGCSTGQEALSLAMLFARDAARWAGWTIRIVGTDVSRSVVEKARRGVYRQFEIQRGLGAAEIVQFFDKTPQGWRAREGLRRMVRFELHNLLDRMPRAASFDLVLCRNVLLYFDDATRAQAFERLDEALATDGWLVLGAGETPLRRNGPIVPDRGVPGVYRRLVG